MRWDSCNQKRIVETYNPPIKDIVLSSKEKPLPYLWIPCQCSEGRVLLMHVKAPQSWPTLCDPDDLEPDRLLCPWDSPGKNSGMCCHALLQGISPAQRSNPCLLCLPGLSCLLHWQEGSLPSVPPGRPRGRVTKCFLWRGDWVRQWWEVLLCIP